MAEGRAGRWRNEWRETGRMNGGREGGTERKVWEVETERKRKIGKR